MRIKKLLSVFVLLISSLCAGEFQTMLVDSGSAKLYTMVMPKQNAESIILLHGGPGVPMDFTPIARLLSQNYQVITFEQRGTGRSPVTAGAASYRIEAYLQDIDAVAAHFGLERFHLFGHSWGGLYAQIYAEKHPQRLLSMFLCSPSSGTGELWKQTEREVMAFNREHSSFWGWSMMGLKSLLGRLGSDAAYQSLFKQVLENYNRDYDASFVATDAMVEHVRAAPINETRHHLLNYPPLKERVDYPFPVIITYGEHDIYGASKEEVKKRFPKATFVKFENVGHTAWKHNYAAFVETLRGFYGLDE